MAGSGPAQPQMPGHESLGSRMTRWSIDAIWRVCVCLFFLSHQLPTPVTVCNPQINISITKRKQRLNSVWAADANITYPSSFILYSIFIQIWYSMRLDIIARSRFAGMAIINYNRNRNTITNAFFVIQLFIYFLILFIRRSFFFYKIISYFGIIYWSFLLKLNSKCVEIE